MTEQEIEGLKKFAREMIRQSWEGYDICGSEVQEEAVRCGLLCKDVATEADTDRSEYSACDIEAGDTIYRYTEFMKTEPKS